MKFLKYIQLALLLVISPTLFGAQTVTYFHNDLYGSPVAATDHHGQVIWQSQQYKPYGERIKDSDNDEQNEVWFTGKEEVGDTGLIYMNARYYDTVTGRFISPDPISPLDYASGNKPNPFGFNLFAYANNNPYRYTDPTGEIFETLWDFGSSFLGFSNAINDFSNGDYLWGAANTLGCLLDFGAAMLPGIPGGASAGLGVARYGDEAFSGGRRFWTNETNFLGHKVYQRNDIFDPSLVSSWRQGGTTVQGTNVQRMASGRAPIGTDGKSVNLHHMTQNQSSALAEMTQTFHQRNSSVIHINPNSIPSGINRSQFNAWKSKYWVERSKGF